MADDPVLLTPGPLTTAPETKHAMLHDWGSRDEEMAAMTARVRESLLKIAGADPEYVCVPLPGSGTYGLESAIGSLVSATGKMLILVNGAYGRRLAEICKVLGVDHVVREWAEDETVNSNGLAAYLDRDPAVTEVALVHCETTTGILNPLGDISRVVVAKGRRLVVDAMSSFGALELNSREAPYDALIAASGKCLEGVPGLAFVIVRSRWLETCGRNRRSLSLDLHDQWRYMSKTGQWRFTPPTHVVAALDRALRRFDDEGGVAARGARYRANHSALVAGMRAMGFRTLLDDAVQAPIIVTFLAPKQPEWRFDTFCQGLRRRNYVIYPGKLAERESFRVGCIGHIDTLQIQGFLTAARAAVDDMGLALGRGEV